MGRASARRGRREGQTLLYWRRFTALPVLPYVWRVCSVSDVSMAEEGPQQGDSDIVVEEEVEENMETDEPPQRRGTRSHSG